MWHGDDDLTSADEHLAKKSLINRNAFRETALNTATNDNLENIDGNYSYRWNFDLTVKFIRTGSSNNQSQHKIKLKQQRQNLR